MSFNTCDRLFMQYIHIAVASFIAGIRVANPLKQKENVFKVIFVLLIFVFFLPQYIANSRLPYMP